MPIALDITGLAGADVSGTGAEPSFRRITPAEFDALDRNDVTLLDLREPADVAAYPIEGAINAPLDPLARVLRTVPKERTVVVYCTEGWWSEEVAEILAERGYDVASLEGGFRAYREFLRERRDGEQEPEPQRP
ncbi:rhodanese-like domain-containing protein [Bifidobacterium sp. CP2]|uniref:rhodanese-like domain-containing protein n=1 Tax=Bifidobacterium TaxID=1678 RepID=UPI001BDDAD9C|nr:MULTISPECIES: rhodanese-like domain-containing protein [Bifidobacterium]MBT1182264.1 rhodanese-like domain-containing protein [Bifidobacterium sp. CP2]MBW3080707.1 rhodanese-like domain-containing protein [Bifidobacterium saguinibicoloris]